MCNLNGSKRVLGELTNKLKDIPDVSVVPWKCEQNCGSGPNVYLEEEGVPTQHIKEVGGPYVSSTPIENVVKVVTERIRQKPGPQRPTI